MPRPRCRARVVLLLLLFLLPADVYAQYMALETPHLRLIYRDILHTSMVPYTAQCFENSMDFYVERFGYEPSERVTIILDDANDFNNAAAFASPRNTLLVQIAPANMTYETIPSNERLNHTLNHEMAHIVALDQANGSDRLFRRLFHGKVSATPEHPETIFYEYLTHPRFAAPRWFHEGVAVFLETWMAGGIGRAQGAYDEMVFRSMVRDSSRFYMPLGLESEGTKTDFQVGANSYLYGARFVTWMAYRHGPEKILEWTGRGEGSRTYYAWQFDEVFGRSIDDAWRDWIAWEHTFQQANLDSLRRYPITPTRDLSPRALGSISRPFYDAHNDKLYLGLRYPGVFGHLAAISLQDGSIEKLCDIKGPALYYVTSLAYDPQRQMLYFTADNNSWRDLMSYDLQTGKQRRLIEDARIGDLVLDPSDDSLWGVRHFNGISTLVRLPYPYEGWNRIHSWPYGQDLYDIDISPDGSLLSYALSEVNGRQTLRTADMGLLRAGTVEERVRYDFEVSIPANFTFSPDGAHLFGSSYYTGVSNVWRYDLAQDHMDILTNSETGFFRPVALAEDSLLVFRYTGEGFVPTRLTGTPLEDISGIAFLGNEVAGRYPQVMDWNVGSPAAVQLDSLMTYRGRYRTFSNLGLATVYPIVEGYKGYGAVGLRWNLSDPGFWNDAHVTMSWTPTSELDGKERLHLKMQYARGHWTGRAGLNPGDFYDLFGPTKVGQKGYGLGVTYDRNLIYDRPKRLDWEVTVNGYGDLERLPGAQNVATDFDKLLTAYTELHFAHKRRSLGAVDDETGVQWTLNVGNNTANSKAFWKSRADLDMGITLPLPHASVWLRTSAGYSPGDRDASFANFYFGGFGNNTVDRLDEKRYRESYAFPGIDLNAAGGTNFGKAMVELNLPPWRFKRMGRPIFYATWIRPALFATGLVTNMDSDIHRRSLVNLGGQIDLRFTVLSRLKMTFSIGYAGAFEKDTPNQDEWMFSLKVL